jgi:hypothetical protein
MELPCKEMMCVLSRESVSLCPVRIRSGGWKKCGARLENLYADFQTVPVFTRNILLRVEI